MEDRMKLRKTLAAAGALAIAGGLTVVAQPAQAACSAGAGDVCSDATAVTVTLAGGTMSIDAPATAAPAGSISVAPGTPFTINVANTSVVDNRGSLLGWAVTGSSQDLTHTTDATYKILAATMAWSSGNPVAQGTALISGVTAGGGGSMGAAFPVAVATALAGAGEFRYTATITGVVPPNLITGSYTGNVTQSLL